MTRLEDLLSKIVTLQRRDIEAWMRDGLVKPEKHEDMQVFSDAECARIQLVCTLHYDLDIELNSMQVIMSLVDQLHDTRERLQCLSGAVLAQDKTVQSSILQVIETQRNAR
jgi:chaperone modulatory protein CbpM